MYFTYLTGRNRTATERTGTLIHAIDDPDYAYGPSYAQAICGARPGRRSNGWSDYRSDHATCSKCIKRLEEKGTL